MSKDSRKDELKKAWKEQERLKLLSSIPMPAQDLRDLFDHLDQAGAKCDHTLRGTIEFLQRRGLKIEQTIPWLREHGGYCDCEVILNVENKFGELIN